MSAAAQPTELRTERLLLRPIVMDDVDALADIYADPEVVRYILALDHAGTVAQVERFVREWDERGIGILAVVLAATGELIGRSGVKYWPQFDETEVGWVLRRERWGNGYATEAGAASLAWAFERGLSEVTAIIANGNVGSIAVAERLGMRPKRHDRIYDTDVIVYAKQPPKAGGE